MPLYDIFNIFTRKNKKHAPPNDPKGPLIIHAGPSLTPPSSPLPSAFTEPFVPTKRHTKKSGKRRRDNSLRRLAILQAYAKRMQGES